MDDLQIRRHQHEQMAYNEIRMALQEDFLVCPELFVQQHGKRPEDLVGHELRQLYSHFLVQQRELKSDNPTFKKRFLEGRLFP